MTPKKEAPPPPLLVISVGLASQNKHLQFAFCKKKKGAGDLNGNPPLACGLESRVQGGVIDAIVDCNIDRWVGAVG